MLHAAGSHSADGILVTQIGSLPRPPDLLDGLRTKSVNPDLLRNRVAEVVRRQSELGIDIVSDGEFGKPSFLTYINQRLGGFEPDRQGRAKSPWSGSREAASFPLFYQPQMEAAPARAVRMTCYGPIVYKGHDALHTDLDNLKNAVAKVGPVDAFVPSISPANIEDWNFNEYYKSQEEYLFAIADAMRVEYRAIADAGFILQIDDPQLVMQYMMKSDMSVAQCRAWAAVRVEALNHALRDIPTDRIRYHTCYGINMGPRVHDMELKEIVDVILKIRAGGYSFEFANPRHEHEWHVFETTKLPEGTVLIPGVVTQSSVVVEHPQLVADRIVRFANLVGRENVIAATDCGFASFALSNEIDEAIVWAKLEALVAGARIATTVLWKH